MTIASPSRRSQSLDTLVRARADRVLAMVRHRQLMLALQGRIIDSAHYADLAKVIRRAPHLAGAVEQRLAI